MTDSETEPYIFIREESICLAYTENRCKSTKGESLPIPIRAPGLLAESGCGHDLYLHFTTL